MFQDAIDRIHDSIAFVSPNDASSLEVTSTFSGFPFTGYGYWLAYAHVKNNPTDATKTSIKDNTLALKWYNVLTEIQQKFLKHLDILQLTSHSNGIFRSKIRRLDPTLLRKGRIDKIIRVGSPSKVGTLAILKPEVIIFVLSTFVALYFVATGLALMYEKKLANEVPEFAVSVGKGLVGRESSNMSDKDIGAAVLFIAVPLGGYSSGSASIG